VSLNPIDIPSLTAAESGASPSPDKTVFLEIDLNVTVKTGQAAVDPMTAVFAADPTKLGDEVDILLWFHGHKGYLGSQKIDLKGYSAQKYLKVPEFKLREFILTTSKNQFLLVVPTLGDTSGAGLLEQQSEAEAFLQQVLNGVRKHMGAKVSSVGNIVLAAHSGGGAIMSKVAAFTGIFDNVKEIWCDDCTYGSGPEFKKWAAKPAHIHDRLWAFSTGSFNKLKFADKPAGPDNPVIGRWGTGDDTKLILDFAKSSKSATIEVLIANFGPTGKTPNFNYGVASGHNESVGYYFPQLVTSSKTLS
jgi:hypothetical protein